MAKMEWVCKEMPAVSINGKVISKMLHKEQELVRCMDCEKRGTNKCEVMEKIYRPYDWFCADGVKRDG